MNQGHAQLARAVDALGAYQGVVSPSSMPIETSPRRALGVLLDEERGFFKDARLDAAGMRTVLELRSKFGGLTLADAAKYTGP